MTDAPTNSHSGGSKTRPLVQYEFERENLASKLRDLRKRKKLTGQVLARESGMSQSKISKIETGRMVPSVEDVKNLLRHLGPSPAERAEVIGHAEALLTEFNSWRMLLRRGLDWKQDQVFQAERAARVIRVFEKEVVPGLLQTAEYAREMLSKMALRDQTLAVDKGLAIRLDRQSLLHDSSKVFKFVITEAALRNRHAASDTMVAQLDRIANLSTLSNLEIGVIAWDKELPLPVPNGFYAFDDQLVTVETLTSEAQMRDARDVSYYLETFSLLEEIASYGEAANRHLLRIAESYKAFASAEASNS